MLNRLTTLLAAAALSVAACAVEEPSAPTLHMQESDNAASGTFQTGKHVVEFTSSQVEPKVWDAVIELNGMTLSMTLDANTNTLVFDGWASDNGGDVQVLEKDRRLLLAFLHELNALGTGLPRHLVLLRSMVDHYSQYGDTMSVRGSIHKSAERSASICWALNSYQAATHDCSGHNRWDDATTIDHAWVSMDGACSGADGTYFYKNGSWQCIEPDHDTSVEYAFGNCFGRCGGGCGSGTVFTWDCLDHDDCVRTGHMLGSFWCSDELAGATIDAAGGSNCL